jgi:selenide,water dikinase
MPIAVLSTRTIGRILAGGQSVCQAAGIPIAGGHTIDSVEPIYGLVALGLVHPDRVKRNADARLGDRLILGKPLGVGVMSAALKKNQLSPADYQRMLAVTTQLNVAGPDLAQIEGVHALTDVTGFGLAGHSLEMARAASLTAHLNMAQVPLLQGVREWAAQGMVTGASARNWAAYGSDVAWGSHLSALDRDLLTDPQTSGGLLVACAPQAVAQVMDTLARHGFEQASEIGEMGPRMTTGHALGID